MRKTDLIWNMQGGIEGRRQNIRDLETKLRNASDFKKATKLLFEIMEQYTEIEKYEKMLDFIKNVL